MNEEGAAPLLFYRITEISNAKTLLNLRFGIFLSRINGQ